MARSHSTFLRCHPTGQLRCLLNPTRDELLVEPVVLADVEVAHFFLLGFAGWEWPERRAAEEGHLHILREAMEAEEPALALDAVEGRVPLHASAHVGHVARDERVEAATDVALPTGHGRDVGLHGCVAV